MMMMDEHNRVLEDKNEIMLRFQETMTQLEEDGDKEIEQLKEKYDTKLRAERDATLRLKGENGIMNKKFTALQKDIDDQKENIVKLAEYEEQLKGQIRILEDKIKQHTTEILEKDKVIGDKEKQMHDLKKDNQELEKFKFVLDYQIKELKATSEPRENEISSKREE
jgi:chromosome segregation ATPase